MATFDIDIYLKIKRNIVESYLRSYFKTKSFTVSPILLKAIKYSLFAGGKRIRPILALASYEACNGEPEKILPQATALELIHTYSLIHDDLPQMDNDDVRRGRPTNHKVFGEAMAILAGDALLTEAFHMMTFSNDNSEEINYIQITKTIREVAYSAGACGMVGGQAQDILSEKVKPNLKSLKTIHLHKTGALIRASVRMGGLMADVEEDKLAALTIYGENIGLAFQVIDDILDVEGKTEEIGKTAGSDSKKKKMTYPSLFGIDESKKKAYDLVSEGIDALRIFSIKADPLREIARYLIKRKT